MLKPTFPLTTLATALCLLLGAQPAWSSENRPESAESSLLDLSLEDLMQVTVTSVSKKAQSLGETAAAVFVINADDIRRSGATNIPEALRLAPGVQVAAIGQNRWSISIRGFNSRFASKLLVLVDGRTIYSPAFSGVFWEHNDVPLEIIERIEVIRGPGGSIWGANAVNGIINIITRSARDTQGGLLQASAGTELRGAGLVRYGWALDSDTHLRVHAQGRTVDPGEAVVGGGSHDDWSTRQAGFRLDAVRGADNFSLQGHVARYRAGDQITALEAAGADGDPLPNHVDLLRTQGEGESAHLLGRWERRAGGTTHSLQAYLDHALNDIGVFRYKNNTVDLEYQQNFQDGGHDIVWGLGFRHSRDSNRDTPYAFTSTSSTSSSLYSAFIQDEIALVPQRWRLTLGSRFEHNDYTGFEVQPNARLLWTPSQNDSVWGAISRAVRTPSRGETTATAFVATPDPLLPFPFNTFPLATVGDPNMTSEKLVALDLGWRRKWDHSLTSELAAFYYRYSDLRAMDMSGAAMRFYGFIPYLAAPLTNAIGADARGVEFSLDWLPRPDWRLQFHTSLFDVRARDALPGVSSNEFDGSTPSQMISLRSSWDVTSKLQWDVWLRHVGKVRGISNTPLDDIPAYTTLDMRLAWKPRKDLTLTLVGQNLLDTSHPEAVMMNIQSERVAIQRGIYGTIDWKF